MMNNKQRKQNYFKNIYKNFDKVFGHIKDYEFENDGKNIILRINMINPKYAFNILLNEDESEKFRKFHIANNQSQITILMKTKIVAFKNLTSDVYVL